jgi:hypothetical protein
MKAGISIVLVASLTVGVAVALTKPVALAQDGGPGDKKVSVWGGVYTAAQSKRGETFYSSAWFNDQDSIDAVAHMFAVSNLPAGDKELPFDLKVLDYIVIAEQPK